jgi:hypothetical protein
MAEKCSSCGMDVSRHGLARYLEWDDGAKHFCSYLCEFFWRRAAAVDRLTALPRQGPVAGRYSGTR